MKKSVDYHSLKKAAQNDIATLSEIIQLKKFKRFIENGNRSSMSREINSRLAVKLQENYSNVIIAGLATFLLHVESRIASFLGQGFYTIGPCGEENMAYLGVLAREKDPFALHYRHISATIARQLKNGKSLEKIILDRARGYTVSMKDSVTGGRHCAIGGTPYDMYVTSTLASQAPPAVGRALGFSLAKYVANSNFNLENSVLEGLNKFPADSVSVVSCGDGSVNNSMMLSALNFADYSTIRGYKCPILFIVSNNDICISLKNFGYLDALLKKESTSKKVLKCDGMNTIDVFEAMEESLNYVRNNRKPAILAIEKLSRRFGHAATDRQSAYLTEAEIDEAANKNPLENMLQSMVDLNFITFPEIQELLHHIESLIESSFQVASIEDKITTREQAKTNTFTLLRPWIPKIGTIIEDAIGDRPKTMRENLTKLYEELLTVNPNAVYVGEDVRHGGYYLVTNGLYEKFGNRIQDIPPDETMLSGLGIGYSQCGLLPIIEIPYAKYLDCGADMFMESIMLNWCTNGTQKNGMVFRLQGFDLGVFGGNFHTHNSLNMVSTPGLDLVCYSNGEDYVKGLRYAIAQAKNGRVIMSVDSTDLLNKRSKQWMQQYPSNQNDFIDFSQTFIYSKPQDDSDIFHKTATQSFNSKKEPEILIYTYGNGVHRAIEAVTDLKSSSILILDSPYLTETPRTFIDFMKKYPNLKVIFADVTKKGAGPLSGQIVNLQSAKLLPKTWNYVGAEYTYNPLGCTATFLNKQDIIQAISDIKSTL